MATILAVEDLRVRFGAVAALDGISFAVDEGTITALIGANGAGKTTCLNVLSGFQRPSGGAIRFRGREITREAPHRRTYLGRTFQIVQTFAGLTVTENVLAALEARRLPSLLPGTSLARRLRGSGDGDRDEARQLVERCGLGSVADAPVEILPLGPQRLVEFARALALEPKVLLLDEIASGLTAFELEELGARVLEYQRTGGTVLLIEHNMRFVNQLAESLIVLDHGTVIFTGDPGAGLRDERVIAAYLGPGWDDA